MYNNDITESSTQLPPPSSTIDLTFDVKHSLNVTIFYCIAYGFIFLTGIVGNALVICVVLLYPKMRNTTNLYIANLALADFLVSLLCVPSTLLVNIFEGWILGPFLCKIVPWLQGVSVTSSVTSLIAIALDRYVAICRNRKMAKIPKRYTKLSIFAIWIFAFCIISPWLSVFKYFVITYNDVNGNNVDKLNSSKYSHNGGPTPSREPLLENKNLDSYNSLLHSSSNLADNFLFLTQKSDHNIDFYSVEDESEIHHTSKNVQLPTKLKAKRYIDNNYKENYKEIFYTNEDKRGLNDISNFFQLSTSTSEMPLLQDSNMFNYSKEHYNKTLDANNKDNNNNIKIYKVHTYSFKACTEVWENKLVQKFYFAIVIFGFLYLLPMCIIFWCYFLIWHRVCRRNLPRQFNLHHRSQGVINRSKLKVAQVLMFVMILFALSWLPLYIFGFFIYFGKPTTNQVITDFTNHSNIFINNGNISSLINGSEFIINDFSLSQLALTKEELMNVATNYTRHNHKENYTVSNDNFNQTIIGKNERASLLSYNFKFMNDWVRPITQLISLSNSCINPIIYTFFHKKYRRNFKLLLTIIAYKVMQCFCLFGCSKNISTNLRNAIHHKKSQSTLRSTYRNFNRESNWSHTSGGDPFGSLKDLPAAKKVCNRSRIKLKETKKAKSLEQNLITSDENDGLIIITPSHDVSGQIKKISPTHKKMLAASESSTDESESTGVLFCNLLENNRIRKRGHTLGSCLPPTTKTSVANKLSITTFAKENKGKHRRIRSNSVILPVIPSSNRNVVLPLQRISETPHE